MANNRENLAPVHLWVFNHPVNAISDQIEFFIDAFSEAGYKASWGRNPQKNALNVLIENFTFEGRKVVADFCEAYGTRVAVIMTEHVDLVKSQVLFHGKPLGNRSDYIKKDEQISRLRHLLFLQRYIRCLFVLGDLPRLENFNQMMVGAEIHTIPFPSIAFLNKRDARPNFDAVFTGYLTDHRKKVLCELEAKKLNIKYERYMVPHKLRNALNKDACIILNIPQERDWKWLSPMRVIAGLKCGRATVSINTSDTSEISRCVLQIDASDRDWANGLMPIVDNWLNVYIEAFEKYSDLVVNFREKHSFPHEVMEYWAITDGARIDTWS